MPVDAKSAFIFGMLVLFGSGFATIFVLSVWANISDYVKARRERARMRVISS